MNILIAEDDEISQIVIQELLHKYGICHIVPNGRLAIEAFIERQAQGNVFDLICLDIMMPEVDGQVALRTIRKIEHENGLVDSKASKIIMTTALGDPKNVMQAIVQGECNGYLTKPIDPDELSELLGDLGFGPVS